MNQTAETLAESVRALPESEQQRFFKLLEAECKIESPKNGSRSTGIDEINSRIKESVYWIDIHKNEYDGQWVCLDGSQLIAHGLDAKSVYDEARSKGIETPFIERVIAKELPWGGW